MSWSVSLQLYGHAKSLSPRLRALGFRAARTGVLWRCMRPDWRSRNISKAAPLDDVLILTFVLFTLSPLLCVADPRESRPRPGPIVIALGMSS